MKTNSHVPFGGLVIPPTLDAHGRGGQETSRSLSPRALEHRDIPPFAILSAGRGTAPNSLQSTTTYSPNGFEDLESKTSRPCEIENPDGPHSQTSPRDHRRDLGPPRRRLRLSDPPILRSRIEIVGSIIPAAPLPYCCLH